MNREQIIEILKPHQDKLGKIKDWDEYAKEHNLPKAASLIYHFGSWSNVKKAFNLPAIKKKYTLSELEEIAIKNKSKFKRKSIWDEYSKENRLPASATFIKAFGSWQKVKEHIGVSTQKRKSDLYTKEDIKKILIAHGRNYLNRKQWDEYAKEHKLPTYKTIKKHFSYDEILALVQKVPPSSKTKNELIKIALVHQSVFLKSSMKKWDEYAKKNNLPSAFIFFRAFNRKVGS